MSPTTSRLLNRKWELSVPESLLKTDFQAYLHHRGWFLVPCLAELLAELRKDAEHAGASEFATEKQPATCPDTMFSRRTRLQMETTASRPLMKKRRRRRRISLKGVPTYLPGLDAAHNAHRQDVKPWVMVMPANEKHFRAMKLAFHEKLFKIRLEM